MAVPQKEVKDLQTLHVVNTPSDNYNNFTENSIFVENEFYTIDVKYPCTSFENLNKITENLIYPYIDNFRQQIDSKAENTYKLSIQYETIKYSDDMFNFKFDIYDFRDTESFNIETVTFDLSTGEQILLENIFKPEIDYVNIISQKVPLEILAKNPILTKSKLSHFTVDKQNLTIYTQINSNDIQSFKVPFNSVFNNLQSSFISKIENNENQKLIAITFDDGPSGVTTPVLLDGLKERNVKATFFMLGTGIEKYPDVVKRIYSEGHGIGNHSYGHKNLVKLDIEAAKVQYNAPNELLNSIVGTHSTVFRPPYGNYNDNIKSMMDTPIILWDIDPYDWKYKDADKIANHIIENAQDGDIILLHDIYSTSVQAAFKVIDTLHQQGFKFVTVDELIRRNGNEPNAGEVFRFERKSE